MNAASGETLVFTSAEIARALGCSKQNVQKALSGTGADGERIVAGNIAKAWRLGSFPPSLMRKLADKAEAKGYRTITDLLQRPFTRFELPFSLAELAPRALRKAMKLRGALQPILPRRNDCSLAARELNAVGAEAYRKEFGHKISDKHWRTFFDRVIERDNGAEEWDRLEIYVEENPARKLSQSGAPTNCAHELPLLADAVNSFAGRATLRVDELTYLWTKACDELQSCSDAGARTVKRAIMRLLLASGFVGDDRESIRRNFDRKLKAYSEAGGYLKDKRQLRYATTNPVVGEDDRQKLIAASLDRGGRISQAFRETFHTGDLSEQLTDRFIANPVSKSYVPPSVRKAITAEVRRLSPIHHGPREHQLKGAYATRDWSSLYAADSFQADDCTCPVVYWESDPTSRLGHRLIRGQLLLMIDERSMLALGFALHSENNYNARIIRALITRVHDAFGLPRRRFYFERGIWRTSKILTGESTPAGELPLGHTELGLREFGVQFCHAKLPRGKVVERVLGLAQNQMERLPGYVGRDEIKDRFERVQQQINEAHAGHRHPSECFLSKTQWEETLAKLLSEYNAERQDGRMLKGLSPIEAWKKFQSPEPQVHLGEKARYLLAHHKLKLRVGRNGITLRPSLGGGTYRGAATGQLRGEDVLVWFNPEEPEYIALTSLDLKRGPFVVAREEQLPAIGASTDQIRRSNAQIDAHNEYARTAYRLIAPQLAAHSFRPLAGVDFRTVEIGEQLRAQVDEVKAQRRCSRATVRKVHDLSRELNLRPSPQLNAATAERMAEGLNLIAEARQLRTKQKEQTT